VDGEVVRLDNCAYCAATVEADAQYCAQCGKSINVSSTPGERGKLRHAAIEFAKGTAKEARDLSAEALKSDIGKKVAAGAALGAVAGAVVPLVGPAIGATLGAGYVAFKRLTK
jgi:hypothetical protein